MDRPAVDGMDLNPVDEDRLRLAAVDRQVDQGVLADLATKEVELMSVDRDVLGVDPVAIDDGRQPALAADRGDLLAGDRARLGGEAGTAGRGGGHRGSTSGLADSSSLGRCTPTGLLGPAGAP